MTTAVAAEPIVETVEAKHGTVTFIETESGWEIRARHRTRLVHGKPAEFTCRVQRCGCRELAQAAYDAAMRKGGYATFSARRPRPICPKHECELRTHAHRNDFDHCYSRGHETKIRALFAEIVKSYQRTADPQSPIKTVYARRTPTADKRDREQYLAWLRDNDPTATNPYAS